MVIFEALEEAEIEENAHFGASLKGLEWAILVPFWPFLAILAILARPKSLKFTKFTRIHAKSRPNSHATAAAGKTRKFDVAILFLDELGQCQKFKIPKFFF